MGDVEPGANPPTRGLSSPYMARLRKRGEKLLHSKYVVILVIFLTVTDCGLVIAELILDLYSVKKTLTATESQTFNFVQGIRSRYPQFVSQNDSVASIYDRISYAEIIWNVTSEGVNTGSSVTVGHHESSDAATPSGIAMAPKAEMNFLTPTTLRGNNPHDSFRTKRGTAPSIHELSKRSVEPNVFYNIDNRTRDSIDRVIRFLKAEIKARGKRSASQDFDSVQDNLWIDAVSEEPVLAVTEESVALKQRHIETDKHAFKHDSVNIDSNKNETFPTFDKEEYENLHKLLAQYITMQLNDSEPLVSERSEFISTAEHHMPSVMGVAMAYSAPRPGGRSAVNAPGGQNNDDLNNDIKLKKNKVSGAHERKHSTKPDPEDNEFYTMRRELHHSKEMEIAHKLHYASVGVVSILLIEVSMKIVCAGSHFFKRKIEVFDAVIILTSFVVDLIFIKGLSEFAVDDSIFVLAILLPWRVIRVVNSLVMAVIDHEHVKLRLLYSRKKKLDRTVETLRTEVDELKGLMQDIRQFCIKEGIDSSTIDNMLGKFAPRRRKDSKFYTLVKLVMSTASMNNNNNDNDSVSSSSMENDLRYYANRDSVLNEATSNENTVTSLGQYLNVPFFSNRPTVDGSSDGQSMVSVERSDASTQQASRTGPSIFVTSPISDDDDKLVFSFDLDDEDDDVIMAQDQDHEETPLFNEGEQNYDNEFKEKSSSGAGAATIAVTSAEVNHAIGNVAFYVGSQGSLCSNQSQEDFALSIPDSNSNFEGNAYAPTFFNIQQETPHGSGAGDGANGESSNANQPGQPRRFGRFLTVPCCTAAVTLVSQTPTEVSTNNSNNNSSSNNVILLVSNSHSASEPHQPMSVSFPTAMMKRSASDNSDVTSSYLAQKPIYGSPTPTRKAKGLVDRRKAYLRSRSESTESQELPTLLTQSAGKGRVRHKSAGSTSSPPVSPTRKPGVKRCRSLSPAPQIFLEVPGRSGSEMKTAETRFQTGSRSMNDVSSAGNNSSQTVPHTNNLGKDGRILRSSCLSLNSERRKRRGKSPHRVSFKVS